MTFRFGRQRGWRACVILWLLAGTAFGQFELTIFHHGDGESAISNAPGQPAFGGVARFATKLNQLRSTVTNSITLSNGDQFLAGPQLDATLSNPAAPFYDAVAQDAIGYDVFAMGNHEFDFGPAFTRRYLDQFTGGNDVWVGANVNYSAEPTLSPLIGSKLVNSRVLTVNGERIGVVGALTPTLPWISSPGGVAVNPVLSSVQNEVDLLRNHPTMPVNKIVLMSHLQSITEEIALIPQLRGVDVVIAGGGEELLSNPGTPLVPGDTRPSTVAGLPNQYPLMLPDADGVNVALVGTAGKYKYIGQLNLNFDTNGVLTAATGNPVRVASLSADPVNGVNPDPFIQTNVVDPVNAHTLVLQNTLIARTTVPLDGRRNVVVGSPIQEVGGVRRGETNLGNLMADSLRWQAAKGDGSPSILSGPIVGLQNGGGIRNDSVIPAATGPGPNFSRFDAFSIAAFANFVTVAEDVPVDKLLQILEHSVANLNGGGQFGQWSGLSFTYDYFAPAGDRIVDVFLEDGTQIVANGLALPGAPAVDFATIDFLASGGDAYPLTDLVFDRLSVTYTQALENYITASWTDVHGGLAGLNGLIDASRYAPVPLDNVRVAQSGRRIDAIPEPASGGLALLLGLHALLSIQARRRTYSVAA